MVVQTHHCAILHAIVQFQALCAPHDVFSGVVPVHLHREGQCVELVAEEGEVLAVSDDGLGHEGPGNVLTVPEACRLKGQDKVHIRDLIA